MAQDVRVKITLDDAQFKKGMSGVQKSMSNMGKSFKSFGKGALSIGKTVAKGVAVVGTAVGGASIALAKTAADLEAMDAQFEATFKGMEKEATTAMEKIGKTTNIHADRMKSTFTKMYSQMKGAGMDANEALAQTEKATMLAADAAAYYDISLEDAEGKLRSFLRGNTEAGDAIGLYTSEAQRAKKATEMYGKSWKQLTEAEKQNVMLNIAEEIYGQSGAMGQAAREAMNFTNVVENLKASFKRLMGTIGLPIMNAMIPVIQNLTTEFDNLTKAIEEGGVAGGFQYLVQRAQELLPQLPSIVQGAMESIANFLSEYGVTILGLGVQLIGNLALGILQGLPSVLNALADMINQMATSVSNWDFSTEGIQIAIEIASGIIKGIANVLSAMVNLFNRLIEKVNSNFPAFQQVGMEIANNVGKGIAMAINWVLNNLDVLIFNMLTYLGNAIPMMVEMGFELLNGFAEGLANGDILTAIGKILIALGKGLWNLGLGLIEAISILISNSVSGLTMGLINLPKLDLDGLKFQSKTAKTEYEKIPKDAANAIKNGQPQVDGAMSGMANSVQQGANKVATAGDGEWGNLANGVDQGFNQANQSVQQGATDMYNGAKQSFSKLAQVGKQAGTDLYKGVSTSLNKMAQVGKQAFTNLYNGGANSMRSLSHTVQGCMNTVKSAINSIGGAVNSAISDYNRLRTALSRPITASVKINQTKTVSTVSAAPAMAMAYSGAGMVRATSPSVNSGVKQSEGGVIENNIYLDGKLIAKTTAPYSDKEITKINNRMNRLGGKI